MGSRDAMDVSSSERAAEVRIPAHDRDYWWASTLPIVLGFGSGLAGLGCWVAGQLRPGLILMLGGTGGVMLGAFAFLWLASRQRWIIAGEQGFTVDDRLGERTYGFEDVICMSLSVRRNYSAGAISSLTRKLTVWLEREKYSERLLIVNTLRGGKPDLLTPLIDNIADDLHRRAHDALEAGDAVEGEGWSLERGELLVERGRATAAFRVDELSAVDVFDDHYCVWKQGVATPVARIPTISANAQLLGSLLQERIPRRVQDVETSGQTTGTDLGRILFERKPQRSKIVVAWFLAACAISIGGLMTAAGVARGRTPATVAGVLTLTLGGMGACWAIGLQTSVFRCLEHGVSLDKWRRRRSLRYTDVGEFAYRILRQYHHGIYAGSVLTLSFSPRAGVAAREIIYTTMLQNEDSDLENLRDHISQFLAARMLIELSEGHATRWLPHALLTNTGIEYRPRGFLRRRAPVTFAYQDILRSEIRNGQFHLWTRQQKRPVVSEGTDQPNFFPGMMVLNRMRQRHEAAAGA